MQRAIIIDIDGTLANSNDIELFALGNGQIDWKKWIASTAYATLNQWCAEIVRSFQERGYQIIFLTARGENYNGRQITNDWLIRNGFFNYKLFMRAPDDHRPDEVIKQEIYNLYIAPYYKILFAIDDKEHIVDMWNNIGLTGLKC